MLLTLAQTTAGADFGMEDLPGLGLAVVLCALLIFVAQGGLRRRRPPQQRLAVPSEQPAAALPSPPTDTTTPKGEVLPVRQWVPLLFELSAHILILAGSGSGKTRTARGLVRYIVEQRREKVIIFDPKANRDTWMGLPALVDPAPIARTMKALLAEFERRRRLNPTLTEAEAEVAFERVWIVVDETSFIRDTLGESWMLFLKRISSMARSLKLHLIVINQSDRVDELGLKGRGDLIANFTLLRLTQAGWQGAPARMEVGQQEYLGEWRNYFPESYRGPALPSSAIYAPPEAALQGYVTPK